jgi:hypothetical protein
MFPTSGILTDLLISLAERNLPVFEAEWKEIFGRIEEGRAIK